VLIHINVVEDLLFYHHPCEDLIEDGEVPWKDLAWRPGHTDGELEEDDLHPPARRCGQDILPQRHRWDGDGERGRPRTRGFINRMSNWMESRSKNRDPQLDRGRNRSWFRGEPSRRRYMEGP
jgi:hypothetical protein